MPDTGDVSFQKVRPPAGNVRGGRNRLSSEPCSTFQSLMDNTLFDKRKVYGNNSTFSRLGSKSRLCRVRIKSARTFVKT